MSKVSDEYMNINECIEYLNENSVIKVKKQFFINRLIKIAENCIVGDNIILNNKFIYIKENYFFNQVELYKNSIDRPTVIRKIIKVIKDNKFYDASVKGRLYTKVDNYLIPLFSMDITFITKEDFNSILSGIELIIQCQSINTQQLLKEVNNLFKGVQFDNNEKNIFKYILDNNLLYFPTNHVGNFISKGNMYPKSTVDKVKENLRKYVREKKVKLINISFSEYLSLSDEEFNENYIELDMEMFNRLVQYQNNIGNFVRIKRTFRDTNVKVIWIHRGKKIVSKKEFLEFSDFKNNYVGNEYLQQYNVSIKPLLAKNNGIILKKYKSIYYINKLDVDRYVHINNYNEQFASAKSMYDKVMTKIEYFPNKNEYRFPKFKSLFVEFIKLTNTKVKSYIYVSRIYNVYNAILNNINIDLYPFNKEENNKLFQKVALVVNVSQNDRGILIKFINYLINIKSFDIDRIIDCSKRGNREPYREEQFLSLLVHLIDIVAKKNNLQKLYRDWNLSSCVLYLFMHYCVAWRKMDLVDQLPIPSIRSIEGITDGESFIKWLEDGNELTENRSYKICKSIEEKTYRLRLKAKKNNAYLNCIISSHLIKEVALLLCINAANREIHYSKNNNFRLEHRAFNAAYLENQKMKILLKDNFDIDLEEILGGAFDNIKMNKGFLSLVKEKSEELGIAYSYYYTQVARGHLSKNNTLSETTKIYLKKDISKASVMVFATGTMGSTAHTLLELVDPKFKSKSNEEKIIEIQNLNMTPYTIERNIKTIAKKILLIQDEIDNFFKQGGYKEGLLQDILYGQNFYGIEEKTKCLIKITRKNHVGITRIKSYNYDNINGNNNHCPLNKLSCIGCEYMISLRYFIYEFEKKFNKILYDLEHFKTELDKEIAIDSINELYLPVLNDLALVLGDNIGKVINVNRYLELAKRS